jgi:hypothetical protein
MAESVAAEVRRGALRDEACQDPWLTPWTPLRDERETAVAGFGALGYGPPGLWPEAAFEGVGRAQSGGRVPSLWLRVRLVATGRPREPRP